MDGIGAVLKQEHDGVMFPVKYASRKLQPAESRYSTIERECLALVWALRMDLMYIKIRWYCTSAYLCDSFTAAHNMNGVTELAFHTKTTKSCSENTYIYYFF